VKHLPLIVMMAVLLTGCVGSPSATQDAGNASSPGSFDREAPDIPAILDAVYPARGDAPAELSTTVVLEGEGVAVTSGDRVTVEYLGIRWSDTAIFDSSWSRGAPFTFSLGAGEVINGWDLGIEGMRVGERRLLVIPPNLAYGDVGAGDVIGPGETLVFVVDLVEIEATR